VESVQRLPEMSETMLGVIAYRSGLVPLYGPSRPLGAALDAAPRAALILALPEGRSALAVDDVDDVLTLGRDALRRSPVELGDGVLVGIARRGADLIGVLDADALVAAFRREPVLEIA
jgi:chemotaxis signal transduction protein